ncbi:hypothetical protein V496_09698 [Pseudogymnoascus sp. VKM F-4515 (FW-2607)]|nr:hypothetical protein V496_09698 [Pseudogymnoascus sp. VKM F-4515 (FW-2607)]
MPGNSLPFRPRAPLPPHYTPRAPLPPHYTRPVGIQKKTRKEKEKERKEKEDKMREVIRAEVLKEIEDQKEKKKKAIPKAPLTHAQRLRKEELLCQKAVFPDMFRAAKAKIEKKKEAIATIMEALEEAREEEREAQREKKELDSQLSEIIVELKKLSE